jgi:superfamily II DNA/RNA helicase
VLVASDGMTRGMDFPGVSSVVNYDTPAHARTYVHRAGRTARTRAVGRVFTILRSEHAGAFRKMTQQAGIRGVQGYKVGEASWAAVGGAVEVALAALQAAEEAGAA